MTFIVDTCQNVIFDIPMLLIFKSNDQRKCGQIDFVIIAIFIFSPIKSSSILHKPKATPVVHHAISPINIKSIKVFILFLCVRPFPFIGVIGFAIKRDEL